MPVGVAVTVAELLVQTIGKITFAPITGLTVIVFVEVNAHWPESGVNV